MVRNVELDDLRPTECPGDEAEEAGLEISLHKRLDKNGSARRARPTLRLVTLGSKVEHKTRRRMINHDRFYTLLDMFLQLTATNPKIFYVF